jgi:hypothetical protein
MEIERVKCIIEEKYAELTSEVIAQLQELAPDEIGYEASDREDAWEAFAEEVQNSLEDDDAIESDVIDELCSEQIEELSLTELKLLWLGSGDYVNWHNEDLEEFPSEDEMADAVMDELYSWLEQKAADMDLDEDSND